MTNMIKRERERGRERGGLVSRLETGIGAMFKYGKSSFFEQSILKD